MFFKRNKLEFQVKFTVFCSYNCKVNAELLGRSVGGALWMVVYSCVKEENERDKISPEIPICEM